MIGEDPGQVLRAGLGHFHRWVTECGQLGKPWVHFDGDVASPGTQTRLDGAGEGAGAWTEFHDDWITLGRNRCRHGLG